MTSCVTPLEAKATLPVVGIELITMQLRLWKALVTTLKTFTT
jgi:hypothetical protein